MAFVGNNVIERLLYFDPVVQNFGGDGTYEDTINDKYEDLSMAVDLTVTIADRYSCGLWKEDNQCQVLRYSTNNGTVSFMNGSDGVLTTNYTEISSMNPSANTKECLGIESINIEYNAWFHPQVTIKFVDVRGATVFQPEDYEYYNENARTATSNIYKALFTFPYPIFELVVKGFYGKGVKYYLSIYSTKMEFDAGSGNFIITASFIGYMYGIFADIPMQYLAIAPYTEKGRQYWESSAFCFEGTSQRMPTFPQLREMLAECTEHLNKLNDKKYGHFEEDEGMIDNGKEIIGKNFTFVDNQSSTNTSQNAAYTNTIIYTESKDNYPSFVNFLRDVDTYCNKYLDSHEPDVIEKKDGEINYFTEMKDTFVLYAFSKRPLVQILDTIKMHVANKETELAKKLNDYNKEKDKLIIDILGFRPTIKNLYELGFAHMSTFMNGFYSMMGEINDELRDGKEKRLKSHYEIGTNGIITDTEDDVETTTMSGGTELNRGAYLPPFTAYYLVQGEDNVNEMVWPEDYLKNSSDLCEIPYIRDLFKATKTYYTEMMNAQDYLNGLGTSDLSVEEMLPTTYYDFVNIGYNRNPYRDTYNAISRTNSIEGAYAELIHTFMHRLANNHLFRKHYYDFGEIEAINLYKVVKDDNLFKDFVNGLQNLEIEKVLKGEEKEIYEALGGKKFGVKGGDGVFYLNDYEKYYLPVNNFNIKQFRRVNRYLDNRDFASIKYVDCMGGTENTFLINEDADSFFTTVKAAREWIESHAGEHVTKGDGKIGNSILGGGEWPYSSFIGNTNDETHLFKKMCNVPGHEELFGVYKMIDGYSEGFYVAKNSGDYDDYYFQFLNRKPVFVSREGKKIVNVPSIVKSTSTGKWMPIFADDDFKDIGDIQERAYLFLRSIPFRRDGVYDNTNIDGVQIGKTPDEIGGCNGVFVKSRLLLEGGMYYFQDHNMSSKGKTVKERYDGSFRPFGLIKGAFISKGRKSALKEYFQEWVNTQYSRTEGDLKSVLTKPYNTEETVTETEYSDFDSTPTETETTVVSHNTLEDVHNENIETFLSDLFLGEVFTYDYYSFKKDTDAILEHIDNQQYALPIEQVVSTTAFEAFKAKLKEIYGSMPEDAETVETNVIGADDPFKNKDFFLSSYMTIKSLYDKWLCGPYNGTKTWDFRSGDSDFDKFIYVDSRFADVGQKLNINVTKVTEWLQSVIPTTASDLEENNMGWTGKTMYDYLSDIAVDCGGNLIALPQSIGNVNPETMFRAYSTYDDWLSDGSCYMFIYPYKQSEYLGDTEMGNIDMNGYSRTGDGFSLTDYEIVGRLFGGQGKNVPAFGVTYAKQNQSYFKNITLQAETNGTSEAAIAATINIASKGSDDKRMTSIYGQDLYKVFSNYAYECTVEMMGDMMIMPPMYFQLNNVPLWKGAYMIKKVTHSIVAGNMTTTFTGIRQNRYSIPFAKVDGIVFAEDAYLSSGVGDYSGNYTGQRLSGKKAEKLMQLFGTADENEIEPMAREYMTTVQFSGWTKNLETPRIMSVTVHKSVANSVQYCLNSIYETGFKVYAINGFSWRGVGEPDASGTIVYSENKRSNHSYGVAIDINADVNKYVAYKAKNYNTENSKPDSDVLIRTKDSPVVKAFKDIGWRWGGSGAWSKGKDFMHFDAMG